MTIESDISEIKQLLTKEHTKPTKTFIAKIQGAGICQGKERYSIYCTKICTSEGFTKGDIVECTMAKIGTQPIKKATDGAFKKNNHETDSNDSQAAQSDRGSTVSNDTKEGEANEKKDSEALEPPIVNLDGTREVSLEKKPIELTQPEEDFKKKYKSLSELGKETMASYHKVEAEKTFGKERVDEILK